MQDIITAETVLTELRKAIVGAIGIDGEIIRLESILTRDLGAESLDFLDINYRMEQTFGVKMARYSILVHAEELFGEGSVLDSHSRLTEEAVVLLRKRFGDRAASLRPGMDMEQMLALVTVQAVVEGVMDILRTRSDQCPSCGHTSFHSPDGCRVLCGACGETATYLNGDDLMRQWLMKVQQEEQLFR